MSKHRIELGELHDSWQGQWVDIKPWMSYSASALIEASQFHTPVVGSVEYFSNVSDGGEVKIDVEATPVAYASAMISQQVVDWHVLGYDGEALPLGRPGVVSDMAPIDVIDVIVEQMKAYYDAQRPNFQRD